MRDPDAGIAVLNRLIEQGKAKVVSSKEYTHEFVVIVK